MINTDYYEIIQSGLPDDITVKELVHGISWTAAVLSDGRTGVAMHTAGETIERMFDSLAGLPLNEAGKAMLSWNMEEASEAFAAVNAFYNNEQIPYISPDAKTLDGIDLKGRTVGMIGMMLGHSNMTKEDFSEAKALYVTDREEKPGAYPDSACEFFLPQCDLIIITGSAAMNKTMPRLLELSQNAQVILTGPSVTCCPALKDLGVYRLNGRVMTDKEELLKTIVEKRTSVNAFSVPFQA